MLPAGVNQSGTEVRSPTGSYSHPYGPVNAHVTSCFLCRELGGLLAVRLDRDLEHSGDPLFHRCQLEVSRSIPHRLDVAQLPEGCQYRDSSPNVRSVGCADAVLVGLWSPRGERTESSPGARAPSHPSLAAGGPARSPPRAEVRRTSRID
jgi:hypothetical protein